MVRKIKNILKEFSLFTYDIEGAFTYEDGELKATEYTFHCNRTCGNPVLDIINKNIEDINYLFYKEGETPVHFVRTPEDIYVTFKVKDLVLEQWYDELFELYMLYDKTYPVKIDKEKVRVTLLKNKNK